MMDTTKKLRQGKKAKTGRNAFKKAFAFPIGVASRSAATAVVSDDEVSPCSSTIDKEGVLIFPTVQRISPSSPPAAVVDVISGLQRGGLVGMRRRSSSKASTTPSSPYQSKKAQKKLPATLKHCRKSSSVSIGNSAWERRQPFSTDGNNPSYQRSTSSASEGCRPRTGSDELPVEVSPAFKFIPIGLEEDYELESFDSDDYDICKVPIDDLMKDTGAKPAKPVAAKAAVDTAKMDRYASFEEEDVPSPVPTDGTSVQSDFVQGNASSNERPGNPCCSLDKYCVSEDDWFPGFSEEVKKLSSLLTCGAADSS